MSYTITEARQALADALNTLTGVSVRLRAIKNPRALDGWTVSGTVSPDVYGDSHAQIGAVILLSTDPAAADEQFDTLAVAIIDATKSVDGGFDVRLDPASVTVGDSGTAWDVIAVQMTVEVQQ